MHSFNIFECNVKTKQKKTTLKATFHLLPNVFPLFDLYKILFTSPTLVGNLRQKSNDTHCEFLFSDLVQ